MSSVRPTSGTFNAVFTGYVSLVRERDVLAVLEGQLASIASTLGNLPEQKASFSYAPGKWTVSEVLGHIIDSERIFGYRALGIARGERASLPPFEQDGYAAAAHYKSVPLAPLLEEFSALRRSHVLMFRNLSDAAWDRLGLVAGQPTSTRAMAFVMAGHVRHHARILTEKYGIEVVA